MEILRVIEAAETIEWLADQAGAPGEDQAARMQMALSLTLALTYMKEYTVHIARGMEPYDALMAAARGELKLSQSQCDMLKALIPRPRQ